MTDNTENLILDHLRAMRASLSKLEDDNTFMKARMSSIEHQAAALHTDMAGLHTDMAGLRTDMANVNQRLDNVESRLDRIERRLELTSV